LSSHTYKSKSSERSNPSPVLPTAVEETRRSKARSLSRSVSHSPDDRNKRSKISRSRSPKRSHSRSKLKKKSRKRSKESKEEKTNSKMEKKHKSKDKSKKEKKHKSKVKSKKKKKEKPQKDSKKKSKRKSDKSQSSRYFSQIIIDYRSLYKKLICHAARAKSPCHKKSQLNHFFKMFWITSPQSIINLKILYLLMGRLLRLRLTRTYLFVR